jgi:hypothetical protein
MGRNETDEHTTLTSSELSGGQGLVITDNLFVANATNTVTISNVAPAAVGTATISKWLSFRDEAGTVYFIPCWT